MPEQSDPFDWCRKRPDETDQQQRERMLASVPEGLRRNRVRGDDPVANYFGLGRRE